MKVSLIVAMDRQRGIGKNNDLLWHLPADMKFFKETTTGHIVVMGRKNYESLPDRFRPLPNRENAVLSRNPDFKAKGCKVFASMEECLAHYKDETERTVFIIGGEQIFNEGLETGKITEMYITLVNHKYEADTFFPQVDWTGWSQKVLCRQEPDEKHEVGFEIVRYRKNN